MAKQKLGIFWDFTRDWDLSKLLHHENPDNRDSYTTPFQIVDAARHLNNFGTC